MQSVPEVLHSCMRAPKAFSWSFLTVHAKAPAGMCQSTGHPIHADKLA